MIVFWEFCRSELIIPVFSLASDCVMFGLFMKTSLR